MNNSKFKLFKFLAVFSALTLIIFITKDEWLTLGEKLQSISLKSIILISVLFIFSQFLNGFMLKIYLKVFGVYLSLWEGFGLISVQSFGNYLPLSAGLASNGLYLKKKKNLDFSKFVSYIAGDTVLKFLTYGFIGIILLIYRLIVADEFQTIIFAVLSTMLIFSFIAIFLRDIKSNLKYIKWFLEVQSGWKEIKSNKKIIISIVLFHILMLILISLQFYIALVDIGEVIGLIPIVFLTILTNVIRIASLFPGNLGLRESISGYVTQSFNFSFALGLVAALITRAVSMFWIFLLGFVFSFYFMKRI